MSLTQQWLRDKAALYDSPGLVYAHLTAALAACPPLRPKLDVYTFDDGRSHLLLCLHGLLPITYRRAQYNIPVALWITRDYPVHPPIVYVVPSPDLLVKPGPTVDPSGRCNLEYMQNWQRKCEGCSLVDLLNIMTTCFSQEPPLYARARPPVATTHSPPPPPPPPPPPFRLGPLPNLLDEDTPDTVRLEVTPPRPPNPETLSLHSKVHAKLVSELTSSAHITALDAERLQAHQTDLLAGGPAIRDEMARLEAVRDVCHIVADRTRRTVQQAESVLSDLRRKGDPEVDELVCATSIVHDQLINLVAEDNAIEDAIYHLHRALNAGRIDLEKFLRAVRSLAEEQFMKRALIDKIRSGLGTCRG